MICLVIGHITLKDRKQVLMINKLLSFWWVIYLTANLFKPYLTTWLLNRLSDLALSHHTIKLGSIIIFSIHELLTSIRIVFKDLYLFADPLFVKKWCSSTLKRFNFLSVYVVLLTSNAPCMRRCQLCIYSANEVFMGSLCEMLG